MNSPDHSRVRRRNATFFTGEGFWQTIARDGFTFNRSKLSAIPFVKQLNPQQSKPMSKPAIDYDRLDDIRLAARAAAGDSRAVALITTRNNQRLFRTAWSVLRNHSEAEDVVQEAYAKAFQSIEKFEGKSSISTWLTRIVLNASIDRNRSISRHRIALESQDVALLETYRANFTSGGISRDLPSAALERSEISKFLKAAIGRLSAEYRTVFVLRDIENMSIAETADVLGLSAPAVKSRLFRARRFLRKDIEASFGDVFEEAIPFAGVDCAAMTARVVEQVCNREKEKRT